MFGIWWPPMFTYLYHSLCVLLFSFMVYFISWCLLICYFFSFLFMLFHFLHVVFHFFYFFFYVEKTIINLNHLHVDPRLSSADITKNCIIITREYKRDTLHIDIILYYIILYYIVLDCIILYYIVLYYNIFFYSILCYVTILY
jgi:hypothetical protein